MARKKTKKPSPKRRRRSLSGVGSGPTTMQVLSVVGGALAGRIAVNVLSAKMNPKIVGGGLLAVGWGLPKFVKGPISTGFGLGIAASGGVTLLLSMGVIKGIEDEMSGMGDYEMQISGQDTIPVLNGPNGSQAFSGNLQALSGTGDANEEMSGSGYAARDWGGPAPLQ
jgi:hypothetical protein